MEELNLGILYEFFMFIFIVKKMWGLVLKFGFKGGEVLEFVVGNGVFIV